MSQPPQGPGWGHQPDAWNQGNPFGPPSNPPFGPPPSGPPLAGSPPPPGTGSLSTLAKGLIAGGVALLAVVGGAVYALDPLGLRTPDTAAAKIVPADATAYLGIDLKPGPAQQAEMARFALKFPSVRENIDLTETGDLRRSMFDALMKDQVCPTVSYDADIEPWLGDTASVFLRAGSKAPVAALAATDEQQARAAVAKLEDCGTLNAVSLAYVDGHLLIADRAGEAERAAADAQDSALSDRAEFTEDMAKVGATGIASFWLDGAGVRAYLEEQGSNGISLPGATRSAADTVRSSAGTLRFSGGNPELVSVSKASRTLQTGSTTHVASLPSSTTMAIGIGGGRTLVPEFMRALEAMGTDASSLSASTGIQFPQDLETLLGEDFILSADRIDTESLSDPTRLPAGVTVRTDRGELAAVLNKFQNSGLPLTQLGDENISYVSPSGAYAQKLQNPGDTLGDDPGFRAAVAEPGRAHVIGYVDVRAYTDLMKASGATGNDLRDLEVVHAIGLSSFPDGDDYSRATVRLTAG